MINDNHLTCDHTSPFKARLSFGDNCELFSRERKFCNLLLRFIVLCVWTSQSSSLPESSTFDLDVFGILLQILLNIVDSVAVGSLMGPTV